MNAVSLRLHRCKQAIYYRLTLGPRLAYNSRRYES